MPMHDSAQEPMPPSSIPQIVPLSLFPRIPHLMIPRGRDNLCRHPFDHLRQHTPTTSASTRRTGTCDLAAVPAFLSTAADAVTAPTPPPRSPPYRRVTDAQMQDKRGTSTSLSPLRAPPIQARGTAHQRRAEQPPPLVAACAALCVHRRRRHAGNARSLCGCTRTFCILEAAPDAGSRAFTLTAGETRSDSIIGGKRRMLVARDSASPQSQCSWSAQSLSALVLRHTALVPATSTSKP
ncbi:hypothetical protein B0H13DRAFT_813830 [Mycena leptocephala]|nr:hypothetical protein B0H13DRAFT_813830 [Mycena leptocephala]